MRSWSPTIGNYAPRLPLRPGPWGDRKASLTCKMSEMKRNVILLATCQAMMMSGNSLIITAPEQLFKEVERLAKVIDARSKQSIEIIKVERFEYGDCFTSWKYHLAPETEVLDSFADGAMYWGDDVSEFVDVDANEVFDGADVRILFGGEGTGDFGDHYLDINNNGMYDDGEREVFPDGYCEELNLTGSFTDRLTGW